MRNACILIFMTILLSGTTISNKAEEVITDQEIKPDSIKLPLVADKIQKIDSLLLELEKRNEKYK